MKYQHAVLWMDHQEGHVVRFNAETKESEHVRAYSGRERLHRRAGTLGDGKSKPHPDYFPQLAKAVELVDAVLVIGAGSAKREFLHFLEKEQPAIRSKVKGIESSKRLTEPQLFVFAKEWFKPVDRIPRDL